MKTLKRSQTIATIRKRFPNQWLLIAVDKIDESTTTPLTGRLIAKSYFRDDIAPKYIAHKGTAMIEFTGKPRKDIAFIFKIHVKNTD